MLTQVGSAPSTSYGPLQLAPFIPVKKGNEILMYNPLDVYFVKAEGSNELYGSAFTFVDFGERANVFLRYCGVQSEPSVKGRQPSPWSS